MNINNKTRVEKYKKLLLAPKISDADTTGSTQEVRTALEIMCLCNLF